MTRPAPCGLSCLAAGEPWLFRETEGGPGSRPTPRTVSPSIDQALSAARAAVRDLPWYAIECDRVDC